VAPDVYLSRRTPRQSSHTGHHADGPSGPDASVVTVACELWRRSLLDGIVHGSSSSRGTQGSTAVGSCGSDSRRQRRGWNPTEAGEAGHSLSVRGWRTPLIVEDQRFLRETDGDAGVSDR
jgi:hypothetical protein